MHVFMSRSDGFGVSFPLNLSYMIDYLFYWSHGYNYMEIWYHLD